MEGNRIAITVSLNAEVVRDFRRRKGEHGFEMSDWISRAYTQQFLSLDLKKFEIKELEAKVAQLKEDVRQAESASKQQVSILTERQKRYLASVPQCLQRGNDWQGLLDYFNLTYKQSIGLASFRALVEEVTNERNKKR